MNNLLEPNSPVRIRNVEASHIGDLIRIAAETNLSHWSAQNYIDEMKNPDAIMLRLVDISNQTIGFVVGRIVTGGLIETQFEAEIYNIAVSENQNGQGRGQILLDGFRSICIDRRASSIWLEVRESNEKAIAFYKRNGFQPIQTRNHFYDNPREHAILMKLLL